MRSYDIIKGHQKFFFLIASHRKEAQPRTWSHCVQLIETHRMTNMLTLRSTLSSRDLMSMVGLDLMRSSYTYFDAYQRDNLDGAIIFALARLVESYWQQTPPVLLF